MEEDRPRPQRWRTDRESLERDCSVDALRASGPGGQHANKRETGVRLRHGPSGVVVTATERRSRTQNLELAFARLAARLDALQRPRKTRRPTRPTRGSKERRLKAKRQRSERKKARGGRYDD